VKSRLGRSVLVLGLSIFAAATALAAARRERTPRRVDLPSAAPTLRDLNQALAAAGSYIGALYNPLGRGRAVTSEYFGLPLRVYLPGEKRWLLAGEDAESAVSPTRSFAASERFRVVFARAVAVSVTVDWHHQPNSSQLVLHQLGRALQPVDLYIGERRIGQIRRRDPPLVWRVTVRVSDRKILRSFRYTVRHGAQLAQNYYRYQHRIRRFTATARVIRDAGFRLDSDLTAPLWGRGIQFGNNLPYDAEESYHDCAAILPATPRAYPYRSKVCSTSRGLYIWLSHSDPLAPTLAALHALERTRDPDQEVRNRRLPLPLPVGADPSAGAPVQRSPRQTAAWLESIYRSTRIGIPRCLPASCERSSASGVRTFDFGALEAMLGYRYHDRISRSYADAIAALALRLQVEADAHVRTDNGDFYRPAAIGSFYSAWDHGMRAQLKKTLTMKFADALNMRPEYTGIVVSNIETTASAYAFLAAYRCMRYRVNCTGMAAWTVR
jgi:hypothetical protein